MSNQQNQETSKSRTSNLSSWDKFFRVTALISFIVATGQLFIPSDYFHKLLFKPHIESTYSSRSDEQNEYIKSKLVIKNTGNRPERNLNISVTMIKDSEIGISNLQSVDTSQHIYQYGLKEVIIKANQFLPEDSLVITFNTNIAQLDSFQKQLTRYKIDYFNPVQPNVTYIKGDVNSYNLPRITSL